MPTLPRVMNRYLKKTQAQTSVAEVAQKFRDHRVGALLVEWNGEIVGIVTERDIIEKVVAHGKEFATTTAKEVMTSPTHSIEATNSLQNALEMMKDLGVRHLVVREAGKVIGIVTLRDLLVYFGWFYEQKTAQTG